jgi:dienelactone hydrolase
MSVVDVAASNGHTLVGFCAKPKGAPLGGLVVIQEFFGVNAHIRRGCEEYADNNHPVVSPAISTASSAAPPSRDNEPTRSFRNM